ncbi:MAG: M28 family peptidase [Xanthomonadales bacterium]|nr:M28 family peptidase [Xanthomonadales bacterium]
MRHLLFALGTLLLTTTIVWSEPAVDQLLEIRLKAHIDFLADDLMLGRQPGSDAYNIAANYVASQYRQMGLLPAGTDGSYLQQVPLRQAFMEPGSAELTYSRNGETIPLKFLEQFYMGASRTRTSTELEAELVFVGYGIDAPELEHFDYADIDVDGKVVVLLAGQPHDFPSEEGAHFASGKEKSKAAVRNGAVGMLMIHTPRTARRVQWDRVNSLVGMPSMGWIDEHGDVHGEFKQLSGVALIRHTAAEALFEGAPTDLAALLERDENGDALPTFDLTGKISARKRSTHETIYSPNVVAVLPGSDPLLAGEYVVYTAHLDHIGELHSEGDEAHTDRINNGALDNASGVSVMLETARLFAQAEPPRRSILFVAVTAEEKGLVGSEYFAMHPSVPIESIVSVVNLDMPLLLYDFGDVIAFGAQHSSLGNTVRDAANSYGVELSPDPFPEKNIFVRSDHYRFVEQGVPSVYLVTGMKSKDGSVDTQPIFEGFLQEHYHKPSDDLNLPIHYGAAARFTKINAKIGELIANDPERPSWHEGDFFGRTFAQ